MERTIHVPWNSSQIAEHPFLIDRIEQSHDQDSGIGKFRADPFRHGNRNCAPTVVSRKVNNVAGSQCNSRRNNALGCDAATFRSADCRPPEVHRSSVLVIPQQLMNEAVFHQLLILRRVSPNRVGQPLGTSAINSNSMESLPSFEKYRSLCPMQ
jgi:hypothetical protein